MPELPDIEAYLEALAPRTIDQPLEGIRLASPFLLRTVSPAPSALVGREVTGLRRLGKRIVFAFEGEHFLVLHLMIAGRLRWKDEPKAPMVGRIGLAAFDFPKGTLLLTEASKKKRAALYVVEGEAELESYDPGGVDPFSASLEAFAKTLRGSGHTLKRALTDPEMFSGIGNAYSDEILHAAKLSPFQRGTSLDEASVARLHAATREVLGRWRDTLVAQAKVAFPTEVTAFREGMAVHGRYKQPCPVCGEPVQRIVHAENESNYCAKCQTGGRLLADRSLSRLLKEDWPKTLEELEMKKRVLRAANAPAERKKSTKKRRSAASD